MLILTRRQALAAWAAAATPDSRFAGVQIGVITYSFRALPGSAGNTLQYCLDCGLSAIELMSGPAESYAGAPVPAAGRRATPAEAEALSKWRLSARMDKFKAFRQMYEAAGVKIYAFKLPPTKAMSDGEYEYIWNVAETLGANHITMELPGDDALLARVAKYAQQRKLAIAFHTHGQGGASGFDRVLDASPFTALNFDVGHYFGVNGESPVPLVEKYHARISSLHLKDRKAPAAGDTRGGANMPWGEGQTPLADVLRLMKRRQFKFPASIEYEYPTPAGSDVLTEIKKCVAYCQRALA